MITLIACVLLVGVLLSQPWNLPRYHPWYNGSVPVVVILFLLIFVGVAIKHTPNLSYIGHLVYLYL